MGQNGWTALMVASFSGKQEVVVALLKGKADPNVQHDVPTPPLRPRPSLPARVR